MGWLYGSFNRLKTFIGGVSSIFPDVNSNAIKSHISAIKTTFPARCGYENWKGIQGESWPFVDWNSILEQPKSPIKLFWTDFDAVNLSQCWDDFHMKIIKSGRMLNICRQVVTIFRDSAVHIIYFNFAMWIVSTIYFIRCVFPHPNSF